LVKNDSKGYGSSYIPSFLDIIIAIFRFETLWVMDISSGKIDEVLEGLI